MSGNCQGNVREFWTNSDVATLNNECYITVTMDHGSPSMITDLSIDKEWGQKNANQTC